MRTNMRNPEHSRTPILIGAAVQTIVFAVLYLVVPLPGPLQFPLYGATMVVGGGVAGWYSERMATEFIDGAMAGGLAVLLSYFVVVFAIWRNFSGLSTDLQIDLTFIFSVYMWLGVIALMQFGAIIGAVTGQLGGKLERLDLRNVQIVWG